MRSLFFLLLLAPASFVFADGPPDQSANAIIEALHMQKIPDEGAWFAPSYRSELRVPQGVLPKRYGGARDLGSAIYALITRPDFSAMHRLLTDETWHFYAGDPIELLLLHPDGRSEQLVLGSDVLAGQRPQFTVPAGVWMGARPARDAADAYSLFGCTLTPGFDYGDYEPGYRDQLQARYPEQAARIAELTRPQFLTAPPADAAPSEAAVESTPPRPFQTQAIAANELAPGVSLRELIGRTAAVPREDYSVAHFSLEAGKGTGQSYNRAGKEFFIVTAGAGTVVVDGTESPVSTGSIVVLDPDVKHAILAGADQSLEFYAVTVPAFSPEDYVPVE